MEPKFSPPSKGGISGLKVIFFFPLLPLGAIFGGVVDFFLCKRGGEAGKEGFSANEKKAWRKIWCGFFFDCGCNGHGAARRPASCKWNLNPPCGSLVATDKHTKNSIHPPLQNRLTTMRATPAPTTRCPP